jgi:hypothetical protein
MVVLEFMIFEGINNDRINLFPRWTIFYNILGAKHSFGGIIAKFWSEQSACNLGARTPINVSGNYLFFSLV